MSLGNGPGLWQNNLELRLGWSVEQQTSASLSSVAHTWCAGFMKVSPLRVSPRGAGGPQHRTARCSRARGSSRKRRPRWSWLSTKTASGKAIQYGHTHSTKSSTSSSTSATSPGHHTVERERESVRYHARQRSETEYKRIRSTRQVTPEVSQHVRSKRRQSIPHTRQDHCTNTRKSEERGSTTNPKTHNRARTTRAHRLPTHYRPMPLQQGQTQTPPPALTPPKT